MKRNLSLIALAALLLPAVLRGLWFYRGAAERPVFATPDYPSLRAPEAPVHEETGTGDEEAEQFGGAVIFDAVHANQFMMSEIASLTQAIERRGGRVELLTDAAYLEFKLRYASAFVTVSPTIPFLTDEIRVIENFVNRGGRILALTDATRNFLYFDYISGNPIVYGDAVAANSLLGQFGVNVNNDYLYNLEKNDGNFRNVIFDEFGRDELTFGIQQVVFYGTHSVESPSGLILLRGTESTLSSANDASDPSQGGAALSADGNVLVFGDYTFMTPPYRGYADNAQLIRNIADFLLSGKRSITLYNFPFVFKDGPVQLYLSSENTKTAEAIAALGQLQNTLNFLNMQVEFAEELPRDGNAFVVSTFAPGEEMTPILEKFDLEFEEGSEYVNVPGFGGIGIYGNTILLFDSTPRGNRLFLFANNMEDAVTLMNSLTGGYLYSCLTQERIAVCSTGFGGTYQDESSEDSAEEPQETPGGEGGKPEATPTPSG